MCWPLNNYKPRLRFRERAQAARAELHLLSFTFFEDRNSLDIWLPLALGMTHGVAHIMTTHWLFPANFTFGHDTLNFLYKDFNI